MIYICKNREMIGEVVASVAWPGEIAEIDFEIVLDEVIDHLPMWVGDSPIRGESLYRAWNGGRLRRHHRAGALVAYTSTSERNAAAEIADLIDGSIQRAVRGVI